MSMDPAGCCRRAGSPSAEKFGRPAEVSGRSSDRPMTRHGPSKKLDGVTSLTARESAHHMWAWWVGETSGAFSVSVARAIRSLASRATRPSSGDAPRDAVASSASGFVNRTIVRRSATDSTVTLQGSRTRRRPPIRGVDGAEDTYGIVERVRHRGRDNAGLVSWVVQPLAGIRDLPRGVVRACHADGVRWLADPGEALSWSSIRCIERASSAPAMPWGIEETAGGAEAPPALRPASTGRPTAG